MIRKLSLPHFSSSEGLYGRSCIVVRVRLLSPLSGPALASWLAPSSDFLLKSRGHPFLRSTSPQAPHPRRLPRLSTCLPSLVEWKVSAYSCATLARGQKSPRSTQAREHCRLCLSQPAVHLLRYHRGLSPRSSWRWQARPWRTHPDLSLPGLSHHIQCPAQHAFVSFENPFPLCRYGAVSAGRRVGSLGC